MATYEFDIVRVRLEPLTKTSPSARWRDFGDGRRALILPCSVLTESDNVAITPLSSNFKVFANPSAFIAILLEPPDPKMLAALKAVRPQPECLAWPSVGSGGPGDFQPAAEIRIGELVWTMAFWPRIDATAALKDLIPAPKAEIEDLVEDLDARSRWFQKRR